MSITPHSRRIWLAVASLILLAAWTAFGTWPSSSSSGPTVITPALTPLQNTRADIPEANHVQTAVPTATAQAAPTPQRNAGITPQSLTINRIPTATMFLRQVSLTSDPRGGFTVQDVDKGSLYAQMGLRPGDRIFSIDTPDNKNIDDDSLEDGMSQTHVEMQVYRDGSFVMLKVEL